MFDDERLPANTRHQWFYSPRAGRLRVGRRLDDDAPRGCVYLLVLGGGSYPLSVAEAEALAVSLREFASHVAATEPGAVRESRGLFGGA